MRFLVPLFVFLAVAAFHSALSASLESAEKEETAAKDDGLTKLQDIDQMEFEAAQKNEGVQLNVTEEQNEGARYLEAVQDGSVEGVGNSDAAARGESSESSEEAEEHHEKASESVSSSDEGSQDSTKEQGGTFLNAAQKLHHKDPNMMLK
ncbi:uncharacterized protein LKV04_015514 isoform 3-T3 [Tautogolabrus adspersus]